MSIIGETFSFQEVNAVKYNSGRLLLHYSRGKYYIHIYRYTTFYPITYCIQAFDMFSCQICIYKINAWSKKTICTSETSGLCWIEVCVAELCFFPFCDPVNNLTVTPITAYNAAHMLIHQC